MKMIRLKKEVCLKCCKDFAEANKNVEVKDLWGFWGGGVERHTKFMKRDWNYGLIVCPFDESCCRTTDEVVGLFERSEHSTKLPAPAKCPYKYEHMEVFEIIKKEE